MLLHNTDQREPSSITLSASGGVAELWFLLIMDTNHKVRLSLAFCVSSSQSPPRCQNSALLLFWITPSWTTRCRHVPSPPTFNFVQISILYSLHSFHGPPPCMPGAVIWLLKNSTLCIPNGFCSRNLFSPTSFFFCPVLVVLETNLHQKASLPVVLSFPPSCSFSFRLSLIFLHQIVSSSTFLFLLTFPHSWDPHCVLSSSLSLSP